MKSVIRHAFNRVNSIVNKKPQVLLFNVFNKTYERRVLVSYIIAPFTLGVNDSHTNYTECYTACKIFDELGFVVDVVEYDKFDDAIDYESYSVIYGFGESFEKLFYSKNYPKFAHKIKKIVYGTGCDTVYSNKASLKRVADFFNKEHIICISSARLAPSTWRCQIVFADLIIALGNEFVANTYREYNINKTEPINIFLKTSCLIDLEKKNFSTAKSNFLWWGSLGAIHKGLDLIIQLFSRRPDITVFICGYRHEYPFDEYLTRIISQSSNIVNVGFVEVGSSQHADLLTSCIATLLPSASEGGAPGIVNSCGNAGLIPIITKNCGIDVPHETQKFILDDLSVRSLEDKIDLLLSLDANELSDTSVITQSYFQSNHTLKNYEYGLKELISGALV